MEAKLFLIGIAAALYTWKLKKYMTAADYSSKRRIAAFHSIFYGLAALIVFMVLSFNLPALEAASLAFTLMSGTTIVLIAAAGGLFMGLRQTPDTAANLLKKDIEWTEAIYPTFMIASVVMFFLVQPFKIPSGSMKNTFLIGDRLLVDKTVYGMRIPFSNRRFFKRKDIQRGDIIVFAFPAKSRRESYCGGPQYGRDFIKRAVGMPGDIVEVRNGEFFVNGKPVGEEPYTIHVGTRIPAADIPEKEGEYQALWESRQLGNRYSPYIRDNFGPVVVPQGTYFAMGDNRDESCDSRFWGPVPAENIKGTAFLTIWPPARARRPH